MILNDEMVLFSEDTQVVIQALDGKYYPGTAQVRNGHTSFIPDDVEAYKKANYYTIRMLENMK